MLPLLTITVFLSAALMFTLQPLVARLLLPALGGSPAVWNTCMVFFQAVLLAGYAYAHTLGGVRRARVAAAVHGGVLVLPFAVLPFALPAWAGDGPPESGQAWWLLLVLGVIAGLPMFAVSATAPLAQRLLASSRHKAADRPYFLYAASNAGSLLALLAYPVVIEPGIGLRMQAWVWMSTYGVFVAMAIGSVTLARRVGFATSDAHPRGGAMPKRAGEKQAEAAAAGAVVSVWRERAWWLALSAVPSSLLLGVTTYLTTDVASIPMLWVLPLAVYLLTFIIAFSERARAGIGPRITTLMLPLVALSVALTLRLGYAYGVVVFQQLLLLFVASLACHVELAKRAPMPKRLTEFYLFVSLGGVLGGVFNSLIAPIVFNSVLEYPLALVAACLVAMLAAGGTKPGNFFWREVGLGVVIGAAVAGAAIICRELADHFFVLDARLARLMAFAPGLVIAFALCRTRPVRFALAMAALLIVAWNQPLAGDEGGGRTLHASRTFFGVHRVSEAPSGRFRTLVHGTTVHGLQFRTDDHRTLPTMYYHPAGPIGHVFKSLETVGKPVSVAVVGLGAGALAAYAAPGGPLKVMDFYEIDPEVVRLARDPNLFTYISDIAGPSSAGKGGATLRFVIGDGRLELARAEDRRYDLIVLDAFSSDAIPIHLLTREALAVYRSRLAPGGLIAIHISNRHIDLVPVVDALARAEGMSAMFGSVGTPPKEFREEGMVSSQWAVVARDAQDFGLLLSTAGLSWGVPDRPLGARPWTDDWSDVVSHLRMVR